MSPTNKGRNFRSLSGRGFPADPSWPPIDGIGFAAAIAAALKREFGGSHAAVKTIVSLTNANERAVKNWFSAKNAPSGHYLVNLMRASDEVLELLLTMAGRDEILRAKKVADTRRAVKAMIMVLEELQSDEDADPRS